MRELAKKMLLENYPPGYIEITGLNPYGIYSTLRRMGGRISNGPPPGPPRDCPEHGKREWKQWRTEEKNGGSFAPFLIYIGGVVVVVWVEGRLSKGRMV